jgi:hypothetical protein
MVINCPSDTESLLNFVPKQDDSTDLCYMMEKKKEIILMSANDQIRSMGLSRTISYNSDEGVPKGSPKNLESRLIKR